MRRRTNWARVAASIFVLAAFFAATCPVMCAAQVCSSDVHQASGHACEQNPAHHSGEPAHQHPDRSDCAGHLNPNVFLGTPGVLSASSLSVVNYVPVPAVDRNMGVNFVLGTHGADASEFSPPFRSRVAIYQKNSDLRI